MREISVGQEFRSFLRNELTSRVDANAKYSLRAFARDIGVSASGLSMVMSGKSPVALSFIEKVGVKLKLEDDEVFKFQSNVLEDKKKSYRLKEFENIKEDAFYYIKDWYHYAILNLMRVEGFQQKPIWIAKRLGISLGQAQEAIDNLVKVGILDVSGSKWRDTSTGFTSHTNNKKFNVSANENQKQLFTKALEAVSSPNQESEYQYRNHTGVTIAIDMKDLEKAKDYITKFRKDFMSKFDKKQKANAVYHIAIGLFPLTKREREE